MTDKPELYFKNDSEWRGWLQENHASSKGVYLIFYQVGHEKESMRWDEAVRVALCFGWIDSTVKSLGEGRRRQYFCPRKTKSVWSKLNKTYIKELSAKGLMHQSGLAKIKAAKKDGSWTTLDAVENGTVPDDLQRAFDANPEAYANYQAFAPGYRKSYLYWLNQAKREETRKKRIREIIVLCRKNIKSKYTR